MIVWNPYCGAKVHIIFQSGIILNRLMKETPQVLNAFEQDVDIGCELVIPGIDKVEPFFGFSRDAPVGKSIAGVKNSPLDLREMAYINFFYYAITNPGMLPNKHRN